jgi:beta-1,4-mannosyltransferase
MIQVIPLSKPPPFLNTKNPLLFLVFGPLKVVLQVMSLYYALGYRVKPARWMIVQIPPSIPTLITCLFMCFIRNETLILDWHNIPHTLLALRLSPSHILVKLLSLHDRILGRNASSHLAVSQAMANLLKGSYGIPSDQISVLHDRPTESFKPLDGPGRSDFIKKCEFTSPHATQLLNKKWRLLVSSTSWTPDEDFGILLDALVAYSADSNTKLPNILAVITGKGPLKESYLARIAKLNQQKKLERVVIHTAFLPSEDYAKLLASADLGVSLHMSSSGVDLPMKVVDMFGAGLPVVGWSKYEAWSELVKEGVNGKGFESQEKLAALLKELFGNSGELEKLREGAMKESERGWETAWDSTLGTQLRLVKKDKATS